jgi:hypothetical protein
MERELIKITRGLGNNLLVVKKELDTYFNSLDASKKSDAVDFIKYAIIPEMKTELHTTEKTFDGGFVMLTEAYKRKLEFLEEWVKNPVFNLNNSKAKLSLRKIALIYVYNKKPITRENSNEKAKKYGYTSGQKLLDHYNFYQKTLNRQADPDTTKKVLQNKIDLFDSIIEHVEDPANRKSLFEDLSKLKNHLERY